MWQPYPKENSMVQVVEELVQVSALLILVGWLGLGKVFMILLEERSRDPAKDTCNREATKQEGDIWSTFLKVKSDEIVA